MSRHGIAFAADYTLEIVLSVRPYVCLSVRSSNIYYVAMFCVKAGFAKLYIPRRS